MNIKKYSKYKTRFIEISNDAGFEVTLSTLGASLFSIKFLGENMTYNPKNIEDFLRKDVYHGKTIGRVAGRISNGEIVVNDKTFELSRNEGKNTLHGGEGGLSQRQFKCKIEKSINQTEILFKYVSKNLECGFPGKANFMIRYTIPNNEAKLRVDYICWVDEDCPISLTNHSYFCLGESSLNNLFLQINSHRFVELDSLDLTLKGIKEVPSYLDFRNLKNLTEEIDNKEMCQGKLGGYDHIMLLDGNPINLENKKYKLSITTSLDAVCIYTDNYDANFEANNSSEKIRRGVAIEPQLNPLNDRILKIGKIYHHFIDYSFSKK